jgi:hypothetical protein
VLRTGEVAPHLRFSGVHRQHHVGEQLQGAGHLVERLADDTAGLWDHQPFHALLRVKGTDAAAVGDAQFEAWPHSDIGRLQNLAMVGLAALDDGAGSAS